MSATYTNPTGGTPVTLPEYTTNWGPPVLRRKGWGFFGANGENSMSGGKGGRSFSVSGACPITTIPTFEGWLNHIEGTTVIEGITDNNVIMTNVSFGKRFKDAQDNVIYCPYEIFFLQLRT